MIQRSTGGHDSLNVIYDPPFPIDGFIKSISIYRIESGDAYISIFRPILDKGKISQIRLLKIFTLPSAANGIQNQTLSEPYRIQKGDIYGFIHKKNTNHKVSNDVHDHNLYSVYF